MNASFVARGSTSDTAQLKELMKAAMEHRGFALIDIFQPCVVYNKINTLKWYREHCQPVDDSHDPTDREAAFHVALEFGERIPTGIIYRNDRPIYEEMSPVIAGKDPLVRQPFLPDELAEEIEKYY
jgi:2-oxoglutarate ferredoxin oxidoreductase subunit beta